MSSNQATIDNLGPALNVVTWFLVTTAVLAVVARVATKLILSKLNWDDYITFVALVPSIAMCATVAKQTENGLGQHREVLTDSQLESLMKASYANDLLYVLVLALTKLSILVFLNALTPVRLHKTVIWSLFGLMAAWGVSSLLVAAFQCHAPAVWDFSDSSRCISRRAFWNFFDISNIVLDASLIVLPIIIVATLQAKIGSKALIMSCFASRILTIAAIIVGLVFRNQQSLTNDFTYDTFGVAMASQFAQALSIITACVPYLKPFFASLQTGMIRTDDLRRRVGNTKGYYTISEPAGPTARKGQHSQRQSSMLMDTLRSGNQGQSQSEITPSRKEPQWDADSQASNAMIIRKTTEWQVVTERRSSEDPPIGSAITN